MIKNDSEENNIHLLSESQNSMSINEKNYTKDKKTYFQNLKNLFKRKVFIFCSLSLSAIFFVVTNIQFWIKDYLIYNY